MVQQQERFQKSLSRFPKYEKVTAAISKGVVHIFSGQLTIFVFLLMDFRVCLKTFSKLQTNTDVRMKAYQKRDWC